MMSRLMWDVGRALLRPIHQFGFRLTRAGSEHIPATGPVLIVCNHLSAMDPRFPRYPALPMLRCDGFEVLGGAPPPGRRDD